MLVTVRDEGIGLTSCERRVRFLEKLEEDHEILLRVYRSGEKKPDREEIFLLVYRSGEEIARSGEKKKRSSVETTRSRSKKFKCFSTSRADNEEASQGASRHQADDIRLACDERGVKRISGLIYEETKGVLKIFLENVIRDVVYALKREGRTLYGFGG
ncbi:hypothetical protein Scep_023814 [Stephania cephalantha]|uniref:Histone H4 n=1 Tax=Stephania cephalantha TaxID=152367 RepID=A0AAP0EVV5_9MAGN